VAIQVSVIGSGTEHEENAEQVGRLLAERGATVVTGGLGEVMAAAARGAKGAGGTTVGILPTETREARTSGSTTSSSPASATRATSRWSRPATR
jgi:uncharacterized protein (TIGR00725 family)